MTLCKWRCGRELTPETPGVRIFPNNELGCPEDDWQECHDREDAKYQKTFCRQKDAA